MNRRGIMCEEHRLALLGVLGDFPSMPIRQVAREFEARTGRPVHHRTVVRFRQLGIAQTDLGAVNLHLNAAQVERLSLLIRQAAPHYSLKLICRRFEAQSGRKLSRTTAGRHAKRLGVVPSKGWISERPDLLSLAESECRDPARPSRGPRRISVEGWRAG